MEYVHRVLWNRLEELAAESRAHHSPTSLCYQAL